MSMGARSGFTVSLLLFALVGCGADNGTTGGGSNDAGTTGSDSSSGTDSQSAADTNGVADGTMGSDTGMGRDGGPSNTGKACPAVTPGDHETYGLPATTGLPTGVSAMTNWTQNPGSGGWNGRQVMDACRYQADPGGFATWHGLASARVEVNPGDDPLALGQGSERAELLNLQNAMGPVVEGTGTVYYATSYYFPSSWDGTFLHGDSNSWSFVMQFYPLGGLAAGRHDTAAPQIYGFASFTFSDGGAILLGKWTDFVSMIDWSVGHVVWWRRDEGQSAFTKVIDGTDQAFLGATGVYVKQGLYRGGDVSGRTDVLWIGPTVRGDSFSAVEQAAFTTNVGPP
jgi:hypothetical protein